MICVYSKFIVIYFSADDESASVCPSTPASQVMTATPEEEEGNSLWSSQDTIHLSDRDEDEAVVCERSILRIVSSSQSFRGDSQQAETEGLGM